MTLFRDADKAHGFLESSNIPYFVPRDIVCKTLLRLWMIVWPSPPDG